MVPIAETISRYVISLVRATRPKNETAPAVVKKYANYGASVRAAQFIVLAAKARALSHKRYHVTYDDITAILLPVLRHRILLNFHAESDRIDADEILKQLVAHVPRPSEAPRPGER
jgi:MoxR-like ATPase